jgi:uncharacterized protein
MRKMVIALLVLGVLAASSAFAANPVRISQVYYGGGAATGYYNQDYTELFNNGCVAVDISGWQLQYGSATGLFASNTFTIFTFPAGTIIQPCGYVIVASGTTSGLNALPVTPDFLNTAVLSLSGSAGKIALCPAGTATGLACAAMQPLAIDMFGWGTATCFEGAVKPALNYTGVAVRNGGGTVDTDNNNNDFTNTPEPAAMHTMASLYTNPDCVAACAVPTTKSSWGQIKTIYR